MSGRLVHYNKDTQMNEPEIVECKGEDCALWDITWGSCALLSAAKRLEQLVYPRGPSTRD